MVVKETRESVVCLEHQVNLKSYRTKILIIFSRKKYNLQLNENSAFLGVKGYDGSPGLPGPVGERGFTGEKGDIGFPGLQGKMKTILVALT